MTKLVVIFGFFVSFAAGLIVGVEARQPSTIAATPGNAGGGGGGNGAGPTSRPGDPRRGGPGMLVKELDLSPQQAESMKTIWSDVAKHGRGEQEDRRRQFRRERDEAIAALVRPEDKEKYDQVLKA